MEPDPKKRISSLRILKEMEFNISTMKPIKRKRFDSTPKNDSEEVQDILFKFYSYCDEIKDNASIFYQTIYLWLQCLDLIQPFDLCLLTCYFLIIEYFGMEFEEAHQIKKIFNISKENIHKNCVRIIKHTCGRIWFDIPFQIEEIWDSERERKNIISTVKELIS